jgi:CBS domain-containing protein
MKVRDVMTTDVVTAGVDTPYKQLVETMVERRVSGIPIVDGERHLLGIVTEADLVDKEAYGQRPKRLLGLLRELMFGPSLDVIVKAVALTAQGLMTESVQTAAPDDDVAEVARRLLHRSIKRMPVVDTHGAVVGIVSRRDLLAAYARPDDDIKRDVYRSLANPLAVPEDAAVEDVHVRNGLVVLRGRVHFPSDVAVVEGVIRALPGVISVECQLFAREPEPERTAFGPPLS